MDANQEDPEAIRLRAEQIEHYRNLIINNDRMTICHLRVFDHWRPRVGAPLAYELARVAYYDNDRYQTLKRDHAL
jgi:hypothetical protein